MSFNSRATARAEALMERLGEEGQYFTNDYALDTDGIFQWSWVSDPVSGVTMDRQMAKVKMLTAEVERLELVGGDRMRFRGIDFRVLGTLENDAGVTTVDLARIKS